MHFVDLGDYVESLSAKQCSKCSGIFISFELLEKAIMHYGLKRTKIPSKIGTPKEKKRNKDNLYPCPICKRTMFIPPQKSRQFKKITISPLPYL